MKATLTIHLHAIEAILQENDDKLIVAHLNINSQI